MIVEPYTLRPAPPRLGLLTDQADVLDENGELHRLRETPKGVQVWASLERVQGLLRAGEGRALCWRGQPIRYASNTSDFRVRILGLPFPEGDWQALQGLVAWRDWLAESGASPLGSLGSSSMSLLRSTLDRALWTSVPFREAPPLRFTVGGRQELGPAGAPAAYRGVLRHFDMRAAYAMRLGGLEYGGYWFRIHQAKLAEHAELFHGAGKIVFCRARVTLNGGWPGPLVRRPRREPEAILGSMLEFPRRGRVQGVWSFPELRVAEQLGCRVRLLEGWVHQSTWLPFTAWLERVVEGRRMEGFAGLLAKATGNALWGQFCISPRGRRQLLYYTRNGRRVIRELPVHGSRRPAHDLSEYLTGSVRAELTLFLAAAGGRLCCAHTDGGWVDCSDGWSYPWRSKDQAEEVRVLDPQMLSFRRRGEEGWRYVVAGWPAVGAGELFEREWCSRERIAA